MIIINSVIILYLVPFNKLKKPTLHSNNKYKTYTDAKIQIMILYVGRFQPSIGHEGH
jgi:hypothetical protein